MKTLSPNWDNINRICNTTDEDLPDLIIVGTDSNSKGFLQREKEIHQATPSLADLVISMIPKPYIERWLLLDSEAFKKVFGKGLLGSESEMRPLSLQASAPTSDPGCRRGSALRWQLNVIADSRQRYESPAHGTA